MKEITQFEDFQLEIWRRPRQRTLNLRVLPDGSLRLSCPKRTSRRELLAFIEESRGFIEKSLSEIAKHEALHPKKNFVDGENFLFFGEAWPLRLVETSRKRVTFEPAERSLLLHIPSFTNLESQSSSKSVNSTENRKKALHKFYREQGTLHLQERLDFWSKRMQLYPKSLVIRGQKTCWGSCSGRGQISLNWKLLAAPEHVIDYVVVHELAHLRHANHSQNFWGLVEKFYPDYRAGRKWLRDNQAAITRQFE